MSADKWAVAQACVRGTSHDKSGAPCQDSASVALVADGSGQHTLAIAVCDGAGSAAYSDVGSQLAASWFIEQVELFLENKGDLKSLTRATVLSWLEQTQQQMIAHAIEFERHPKDYSCTLLSAIVGPADAVFLQVGDGAIVVSNGNADGWSYLFWPQHGEFANSTNFIQSDRLPEVLDFSYEPRPIREVAVFSDGIENLVLHKSSKSVHEPFFERNIKPLRSSSIDGVNADLSAHLSFYLGSTAVCDKTDDDKTLVMATRCRKSN